MAEPTDRTLATELFNRCWEIMEMDARSVDDDVELITAAFASRYHWLMAGGPEQLIVSDWMVSRASGVLGAPGFAVLFAHRAHDAAKPGVVPDWLLASTAEGIARAYLRANMVDEFVTWNSTAARLVEEIADDDDRALVAGQLAELTLPSGE